MHDTIHTLQVTDTIRVTVQYDDHSPDESPLDWSGSGYVSIRHAYHGSHLDSGAMPTPAYEVRNIHERLDATDSDAADAAIVKHYARQRYAAQRFDLRGSSQSDWHDGFIFTRMEDAQYLDSIAHTLQSWYAGEVYVVTLERLEVWSSLTQPGERMTTWEVVDSLGGCYLDNFDDDLVSIARDLEGYPLDTLPAAFPGEVVV